MFAIAHVRGGGEMGRPWYDDGKLLHKRNTFTDFIACAEHLVAEGFTAPERLVARGGSAGGLLMGAVANLRPDLFAAVVAEVPFVDCLTTILDETLPLTVTEWEEWGNPVADPDVYAYMKGYSPYDNVGRAGLPRHPRHRRAQRPPGVVLGAGQVGAGASAPRPRATAPIYLKTEMGAGHQGPSGRYDAWKDEAFVYAFVLDALGRAWRSGRLGDGAAPGSVTHAWSARQPGRAGSAPNTTRRSPASDASSRPSATTTSSPRRTTATRAS